MREEYKVIPNLSIDCVIFGYSEGELKVLLRKEIIEYNNEIHIEWKLPGNHVRLTERIEDTAIRVLKEQAGAEKIFMKQFQVFSELDRLKRREMDYEWIKKNGLKTERVVTVAFYSLVKLSNFDSSKLLNVAEWHKVNEVGPLIFDHKEILDEALLKLKSDILTHPLAFELLPKKFTLTQLKNVYEVILNTEYDKRNFRRKIHNFKYIVSCNEKQYGVAHKAPELFHFDAKIYARTHDKI
ncbi:MAG: NUDIX domain-containing protein [Bacteroidales bacterium]